MNLQKCHKLLKNMGDVASEVEGRFNLTLIYRTIKTKHSDGTNEFRGEGKTV